MNDIVRKKRRKFILILIVIFIIAGVLVALTGVIDYFRAASGEKPIFIYHTASVQGFDVEIAGFEDSALLTNEKSENYYGLWYMVSICDSENKNYHFQIGHSQKTTCRESLSCTKTFADNDNHNFNYSFFDNKLVKIDTTLTIPSNQIVNVKNYEKEFMKINDITGCNGSFNKLNENVYISYQSCNISKMSDEDIMSVYITDRKSLVQSKDKVIKSYLQDKDMKCE